MHMPIRARAPFGGLALLLLLAACETPSTETTSKTSSTNTSGSQSPLDRGPAQPSTLAGTASPLADGADRVLFAYDRSELSPTSRGTVAKWGDYLRREPGRNLLIEGHADERGTREYNLALGERRAAAVREYLLALGAKPTQLRTASYGKERPAVAGSSEQAWSQNRRAVAVTD